MLDIMSFAASNRLRDNAVLPLSAVQLDVFDAWRSPRELLEQSYPAEVRCPTMLAHGKVDLVQDITTDCSVVASLCAATARTERGNADVNSNSFAASLSGVDRILDRHPQHLSLRPGVKATDHVA